MTRARIRRAVLALLAVSASLLGPASAPAAAAPFCDIDLTTAPNCYAAVDDGTVLAMSVSVPDHCNPAKPAFVATCPTIYESAGYENGSAEEKPNDYTTTGELFGSGAPLSRGSGQLTQKLNKDYAIVHVSIRGTGCSGGEFDLFSLRSALDGKQIIDGWIAKQPWSNGKVGILGHSYSGITGTMIAQQQPRHLDAITVSGLIDDLYRGITYIGGVSNMGFPVTWTLGVRQAYDFVGGIGQGLARPVYRNVINPYGRTFDTQAQLDQCVRNVSTRNRTTLNDPVVQGAVGDTDNTWWQVRALSTFMDRIDVPTWISGTYQDEQTGPRGTTRLWEQVSGVPKRLTISNGDHGTNQDDINMDDRKRWMDHWLRGIDGGFGPIWADRSSVTVFQEYRNNAPGSRIDDVRFPLTDTRWTDWYFHADGSMSTAAPAATAPGLSYLSGSGRQSWFWETGPDRGAPFTTADGPDELTFKSAPLAQPLSIAGPITATLHLSSTAPDTELFVQLIDENVATGERQYLQRGMLKASHRAIDLAASNCVYPGYFNLRVPCGTPGSVLYRPHRPHTNPTPVTPGESVEYLVEVFPVGHVFRPGHRIMVKIMAPPKTDSYYAYVPRTARAVNTLSVDAAHPSRIMLPVIPNAPIGASGRGCSGGWSWDAVRCVSKPNG